MTRTLPILALLMLASPALADPCSAPLPKPGTVFSGPVRYVGDGDSICVASPAGLIEIRVADYFAPELHEPGGKAAKQALQSLAMGRVLVCQAQHRSFDRIVAQCTLNGKPLGDLLRKNGSGEGGRGGRR